MRFGKRTPGLVDLQQVAAFQRLHDDVLQRGVDSPQVEVEHPYAVPRHAQQQATRQVAHIGVDDGGHVPIDGLALGYQFALHVGRSATDGIYFLPQFLQIAG